MEVINNNSLEKGKPKCSCSDPYLAKARSGHKSVEALQAERRHGSGSAIGTSPAGPAQADSPGLRTLGRRWRETKKKGLLDWATRQPGNGEVFERTKLKARAQSLSYGLSMVDQGSQVRGNRIEPSRRLRAKSECTSTCNKARLSETVQP
jgi:hypothetical protein